jgi:hypothetical protein
MCHEVLEELGVIASCRVYSTSACRVVDLFAANISSVLYRLTFWVDTVPQFAYPSNLRAFSTRMVLRQVHRHTSQVAIYPSILGRKGRKLSPSYPKVHTLLAGGTSRTLRP